MLYHIFELSAEALLWCQYCMSSSRQCHLPEAAPRTDLTNLLRKRNIDLRTSSSSSSSSTSLSSSSSPSSASLSSPSSSASSSSSSLPAPSASSSSSLKYDGFRPRYSLPSSGFTRITLARTASPTLNRLSGFLTNSSASSLTWHMPDRLAPSTSTKTPNASTLRTLPRTVMPTSIFLSASARAASAAARPAPAAAITWSILSVASTRPLASTLSTRHSTSLPGGNSASGAATNWFDRFPSRTSASTPRPSATKHPRAEVAFTYPCSACPTDSWLAEAISGAASFGSFGSFFCEAERSGATNKGIRTGAAGKAGRVMLRLLRAYPRCGLFS
eukprot:1186579-Prorocentrum_minimum.AAC.4